MIIGCAVSAGVHAALTPDHFREGAGAGTGFVAATVAVAVLAVVLSRRAEHTAALLAATVTLAGLLGSYALAVTTGVPVVHPEAEHVEGLALVTKSIEAVALLAAAISLRPKGRQT